MQVLVIRAIDNICNKDARITRRTFTVLIQFYMWMQGFEPW